MPHYIDLNSISAEPNIFGAPMPDTPTIFLRFSDGRVGMFSYFYLNLDKRQGDTLNS